MANEETVISCPPDLDIAYVGELHRLLGDTLEGAGEDSILRIDASAVERVDGAALQTLCAFFIAGESLGVDVGWSGVSPKLADGARITGLERVLHLSGDA